MVAHLEAMDARSRAGSAHLERLAGLLCESGLYARLNMPVGRPPNLHVVNPEVPGLEEHVLIERRGTDELWLRWAWAEEIAPAHEMDRAVASIRRVLGVSR